MNTKMTLIGSGIAAAVLTGAIFAWSTVWPTAPGYAAGVVARQVHFGGHGGWRHDHAQGLAMICSDRRDRRIENGLAFVEGLINFTPDQNMAWSELAEAVRDGSATIDEKCEELKQADMPDTAPERLARFETLATTGLDILQRISPAFERFYATLSDKQKKALDDLISHRDPRT